MKSLRNLLVRRHNLKSKLRRMNNEEWMALYAVEYCSVDMNIDRLEKEKSEIKRVEFAN